MNDGKMINSNLIDKLTKWDGIHIKYLSELYAIHFSNKHFFEELMTICNTNNDLEIASTWLIKHHYDSGKSLSKLLTKNLLKTTKNIQNLEAKLHILQLLPHFKLSTKSIQYAEDFVRKCLLDKNKFVKAWALNGLFELTFYIPEMKPELISLCQIALEKESPAIKSKARKILLAFNHSSQK